MAVQQLQLPTNQINNLADQAQWSTLGNLGNVYQAAQDRARQQAALASLGTDPMANTQALIKSGIPELAQLGVQMQNRLATQAEDVRQFNLGLQLRQQAATEHQREFTQEQAIREQQAQLAGKKFEADSPEYRSKQLDDMIEQGVLPPEAKKDPAWRAWQATGQNIPAGAIVAPQTAADRKAIRDADQQVASIGQTIGQLDQMKENIDKALHLGPLTGPVGYAASFLPEGYGGTAGKATEMITNEALRQMIGQVKTSFGGNPSNKEDAWLLKAQASVEKSPKVQKEILDEGRKLLVERQKFARDQAAELRGGTYYSKGHENAPSEEPTPAPAPTTPAATPTAKPDLKTFMDKARAANPGVPDSELAKYWNSKYGGR